MTLIFGQAEPSGMTLGNDRDSCVQGQPRSPRGGGGRNVGDGCLFIIIVTSPSSTACCLGNIQEH